MQETPTNGHDGRRLVAWAWIAGMLLYGGIVLALPWLMASDEQWQRKGQGTALLMVAASMLFVLAFDTWIAAKDRLVRVAAALTALFGFLGTAYSLSEENDDLLALWTVSAVYSLVTGPALMFFVRFAWRRAYSITLHKPLVRPTATGRDLGGLRYLRNFCERIRAGKRLLCNKWVR